ncbi:MAG: AAA family ATPase [Dehalococcoidia bacterium]
MLRGDVSPESVLSEGERTCVALAGFLAELKASKNSSAIVLDDPVTSLDHKYRRRVAELLVNEACTRQVVVFTHDIVFLFLLRKYTATHSVVCSEVSLERGYKEHGIARDGPPWVALSVSKRIGVLRNALQEARALQKGGKPAELEQKLEWIYKRLRQTWERSIEEVLLNGVVTRFGESVQTQRLRTLTDITYSDIELVDHEMARCSDYVHDESGAVNAGLPDCETVSDDVERLATWVKQLRKERSRG